jgi:polar amino acid transport system substrate-binding protein
MIKIAALCWGWLFLGAAVLADSPPLRMGVSEWPPYEFAQNGVPRGLDIELARAAVVAMKAEPAFEFYPWKRVLLMAQRQEIDAILSVRPTPERQQYLLFPREHLSVSENVLFVRKGEDYHVPSVAALAGKMVGVTASYSYGEELDALVRSGAVVTDESHTDEQGLRKLMAVRYDMFVCDRISGWYLAQSMGIADQISALPLRVSTVKNYLAFSRTAANTARVARFDAAVTALKKSGEWQRIVDGYLK